MPVAVNPADGSLLASVVSGGGGGTQYAEGATTSPGTGTLAIGRYNLVAPTLTDGELYGLQLDSSGNLKVTGSLSVGGTTDNSSFTAGTSTGTPAMGFYHSTIDTVTDGRSAAVAITSKRGQHSNLRTAAGVELLGQTTMAGSIPVTLASDQTTLPDTTQTGSITSIASSIVMALNGQSTVGINVGGTFSATLQVSVSVDGSTYTPTTVIVLTSGAITNTITTATTAQINTAGMVSLKVIPISYTSGTANVSLRASTAISTVMLDNSLPSGTNTIGAITGTGSAGTAASGVLTVQGIASMTPVQVSQATASNLNATVVGTGTFAVQAAQSGTWTNTVTQATASNLNATVVGTGTFAVQNTPTAPTTIFDGKTTVTTAGTRVALASSQAVQSVTIKALSTNTGIIYVGNSSVASTNGFQLSAGDSVSMDIANLATVFLDCSNSGEGVTYLGVN